MKRKIQFGAAFISAVLLLAVTGCGSSKEELPPTEEGQEALQNASVLTMKGDLDDIVADSDIWADGQAIRSTRPETARSHSITRACADTGCRC